MWCNLFIVDCSSSPMFHSDSYVDFMVSNFGPYWQFLLQSKKFQRLSLVHDYNREFWDCLWSIVSWIKNAVVAKFRVQPVLFCLKILNISRLPVMGFFCEEFQHYRWQSIPTKFQVPLQVQHAWIQNKKVGTWMPSSRLPSQLSINL